MNCPKCSSPDTVSCAMAFEQGTSTSKIAAVPGAGGASREVTSHTAFAQRAAPPSGSWMGILVVLLLVSVGLTSAFLSSSGDPGPVALIFPAAAVACIVGIVISFKRLPMHRERREQWSRSWICHRCGSVFQPN